MSYARGELYVYEDVDRGFTCMCPYTANIFTTWERSGMLLHLQLEMQRAMDCVIHDAHRVAVFTKAWMASVRLYEEINDPDLPHYTR